MKFVKNIFHFFQPYDSSWIHTKRDNRSQRSKPYNRKSKPFNRVVKPKQNLDENVGVTNFGSQGGVPAPRTQRHNSPSSDESVGPFPSSSGALRKVEYFGVVIIKI